MRIGIFFFKTLLNSIETHSIPFETTATTIKSIFLEISFDKVSNLTNLTFLGGEQLNEGWFF